MTITVQGTVPYPPHANAQPILTLATNLQQMSQGLMQGSQHLLSTAGSLSQTWTGEAAQSFNQHMNTRAKTVTEVATALGRTVPVLQTFAAAITSTSATYSAAATVEIACRGGLPWTAAAMAAAIATESVALAGLQAAGAACASALIAIEVEVARAEFAGVDKAKLEGLKEGAKYIWDLVADKSADDDGTAQSQLDVTTDVAAIMGVLTGVSKAKEPVAAWRQDVSDAGKWLGDTWHTIDPFMAGAEKGVHELHHWITDRVTNVNRANGTQFTRWKPGHGGTFGTTGGRALARVGWVNGWMKKLPYVGVALDGISQAMSDAADPGLTTTHRVTRTAAAAGLQGGGAAAGALAGGKALGAAGFLVAGPVGAFVGGVVGAGLGALGGSQLGKWVKNELFNWNPGGWFK